MVRVKGLASRRVTTSTAILGRDCSTTWKALWRAWGERYNVENALGLYDVQCLEKNALTAASNTTFFKTAKLRSESEHEITAQDVAGLQQGALQ